MLTLRLLRAAAADVRHLASAAFLRFVLGVQCDRCLNWYRGPRTLARHVGTTHAGDRT